MCRCAVVVVATVVWFVMVVVVVWCGVKVVVYVYHFSISAATNIVVNNSVYVSTDC